MLWIVPGRTAIVAALFFFLYFSSIFLLYFFIFIFFIFLFYICTSYINLHILDAVDCSWSTGPCGGKYAAGTPYTAFARAQMLLFCGKRMKTTGTGLFYILNFYFELSQFYYFTILLFLPPFYLFIIYLYIFFIFTL
jgi:hypothetical protein